MRDQDQPPSRAVRVWIRPALIAVAGLGLVALALPSLHGWSRGTAAIAALVWLLLGWRIHLTEARKQ